MCSAMYEKCGELDKSLNDIMVVLTMDPSHLKARIRRARILEAQVHSPLMTVAIACGGPLM